MLLTLFQFVFQHTGINNFVIVIFLYCKQWFDFQEIRSDSGEYMNAISSSNYQFWEMNIQLLKIMISNVDIHYINSPCVQIDSNQSWCALLVHLCGL